MRTRCAKNPQRRSCSLPGTLVFMGRRDKLGDDDQEETIESSA
jgi:hypothetical protein